MSPSSGSCRRSTICPATRIAGRNAPAAHAVQPRGRVVLSRRRGGGDRGGVGHPVPRGIVRGRTRAGAARRERLLEHDTAGDPISGLRWSRRTPRTIAELLTQHGWRISPNTVARLLHHLNYSRHVNPKQVATTFSPDRNQQFPCIRRVTRPLAAPPLAYHQRRYQEARTRRPLQERGRALGSGVLVYTILPTL